MKKILSLLLIISILALTSCSKSDDKKESVDSKQVLKLYTMDYDNPLKSAVTQFNNSNDKVSVELIEFKNIEEYMNKINTETVAGKGPDIFLGLNVFKSLSKVISSGALCDLNELIKKDKSFKLSEYNKNIMNLGVIDGKRYILPTEINHVAFFTTKEILAKNNININDSTWTWKDFAGIAKDYAEKNKGKDKYLVGWNFSFSDIIKSCGVSFIDYDKKKCSFDTPEFIELLQAYKDMYPAVGTNEVIIQQKKISNPYKLLDNGTVLMFRDIIEPYRIYTQNAIMKNMFKSETQMLSLPTSKSGSPVSLQLGDFAAINSNCKYKQQAFNFIKTYLAKENRVREYNFGISVNNSIFKDEMNYYLNSDLSGLGSTSFDGYSGFPINISKELFNKTNEIVNRTTKIEMVDKSVFEIINSELPDMLSGKKTPQQVGKRINDKVTIFLNE